MTSPLRHPDTGYRYTYVIPPHASYADVRASYGRATETLPYLDVLGDDEWAARCPEILDDPSRFVVIMGSAHNLPQSPRRCGLAIYYSEMIGPPEDLPQNQRPVLQELRSRASSCDAVLVHTPMAADFLRGLLPETPLHVAPSGYDPVVMGLPDASLPKANDLVFYGFTGDRRRSVLELLRGRLKHRLTEFGGSYGRERHAVLNASRAILNIHHGPRIAHAAFRTWQAVATSAPLIMEPLDAWPSVAGRHYIEIPWLSPDNAEEVGRYVDDQLREAPTLMALARRAHEELSEFSIRRCVEDYVVPISVTPRRTPACQG